MNNLLTIKQIILCPFLILSFVGFGQPTADIAKPDKQSLFELFKNEGRTELILTANFDSIKANIRSKDYAPGVLELKLDKKSSVLFPVKLRSRGKSRRMMCEFPPLKVKFQKAKLDSLNLEIHDEFKLVTHCQETEWTQAVIMREYLIYQLYNVMTPYSFKAKLVNITYKNTGSSFKKTKNIGIIIEDPEAMAQRNQCNTLSQRVIKLDSLQRAQEKIASVFQFMIGNADWSYAMARNTELIQMKDGQIIPVPYDFDYAGLVKAPYARANAALGQISVLDRVYLGSATKYEELEECFHFFQSKKEELLNTLSDFKGLDFVSENEMRIYLNDFFNLIENRKRVENEMLKRVLKG